MGSKIGLLLSMIFITLFFVLGGDIISVQYLYSDLDAKGVTISYLISKTGRTDSSFKNELEKKYNVTLTYESTGTPMFGDVFDFILSTEFEPMIMSNDKLLLKIKRTAIIGYYG